MIDRANIIYISIFIFINSVFYSILDLHTSDKIFSTTDFYIAIFFYFAYKFFPALIMGNILIKDLNNNKLILFLMNFIIAILSLPTFYTKYINTNPNDISYFIHSFRELYNFFSIIIIFINILLKNNSLFAIANILSALIIFKSKIFLLTIILLYLCVYVKNRYRLILILSIITLASCLYLTKNTIHGFGRDSEINHIAFTNYSVNSYGLYNDNLFGKLIVHSAVPNVINNIIFNENKEYINVDKIFSVYYGYPIEDYNTNPVIPFILLYGFNGILLFLLLYFFYIFILTKYLKSNSDKLYSIFLIASLFRLHFYLEVDLIIIFQLIKWQIALLIIFYFYKKCF